MSVLNPSISERILIKEKSDYRKQFKDRLKELINAEGDMSEQAKLVYADLFPRWETKAKGEAGLIHNITNRQRQYIPYLKCRTCGKISYRVMELESPLLYKEKRKTWKRIIKPSYTKYMYHGRQIRNKRIFWSAEMHECVRKRHKIGVRYLETTLKERGFTYG